MKVGRHLSTIFLELLHDFLVEPYVHGGGIVGVAGVDERRVREPVVVPSSTAVTSTGAPPAAGDEVAAEALADPPSAGGVAGAAPVCGAASDVAAGW